MSSFITTQVRSGGNKGGHVNDLTHSSLSLLLGYMPLFCDARLPCIIVTNDHVYDFCLIANLVAQFYAQVCFTAHEKLQGPLQEAQ